MRLDSLLRREDFFLIFRKSLQRFLIDPNSSVVIYKRPNKQANYYVLPLLNLIFPSDTPTQILFELSSQYIFNPNPIKRLLNFLYVFIATLPLFRFFVSSHYIFIPPLHDDLNLSIFLPGNHSIKSFKPSSSSLIVFRKSFESIELFDDCIRNRFLIMNSCFSADIKMPVLSEYNKSLSFYAESFLPGLPLNRISSKTLKHEFVQISCNQIILLTNLSRSSIQIANYSLCLLHKVFECLRSLPDCYPITFCDNIKSIVIAIYHSLSSFSPNHYIPTSLTHGDFQPANILIHCTDRNSYPVIIDWEFLSIRSSWYDLFVFHLNTRSPLQLSSRLLSFSNDIPLVTQLINCVHNYHHDLHHSYIQIFLLEDILFRLRDSSIFDPHELDIGLTTFIDELLIYFDLHDRI
tara:strand:- start:2393 stop:3610 length:1218 start_codon:yes stop_codon:yes gene_type:complete